MIIVKKSNEIRIRVFYLDVFDRKTAIYLSISDNNELNVAATGSLNANGVKAFQQAMKIAEVIIEIGFDNYEVYF